MPRGGARVGAGRKPTRRVGAAVVLHPSSPFTPPTTNPPSPIEEFDAPDDLTFEERAVWLKQAPFAFQHRTLVRSTALAFERYCKLVVLERNEAKGSGVMGPNHRGILREIRSYEQHFLLIPMGKAMPEPAEPPAAIDQDDAYFGHVG